MDRRDEIVCSFNRFECSECFCNRSWCSGLWLERYDRYPRARHIVEHGAHQHEEAEVLSWVWQKFLEQNVRYAILVKPRLVCEPLKNMQFVWVVAPTTE